MLFRNVFEKRESSDLINPADWLKGVLSGGKTYSGESVTEENALESSAVYACVKILSDAVGKMPLQTFKKTSNGRDRDKNHIVSYLLESRPNPYMSPFVFKSALELCRNLWGNGYANIEFGVDGFPKALWLLSPSKTEPFITSGGNLEYITVLPSGEKRRLRHEEVIHVHTMTVDGLKGKSPIRLARETIGINKATEKFTAAFYGQGTVTNGVLTSPTSLNKDAKAKVRSEWESINGVGLTNAHRLTVLDQGWDYKSIGMPLKDAEFIATQKFSIEQIARFFNVPLNKINAWDRATWANSEQASMDFLKDSLDPILVNWEQEFEYKLFTQKEQKRYSLEFNREAELRIDSKTKAEFITLLVAGGLMSINEGREKLNMSNIGEEGDKHHIQSNMTTLQLLEDIWKSKNGKGGE
jgi:HK97 family phage portal protein